MNLPKNKKGVLLKIYLTRENNPTTHIDCAGTKIIKDSNGEEKEHEFSFFPSEEEVLLFPYFGFLTLKNEKMDR
tara:strand:+ start:799 stop:1020 length:222 start_codon:yes stop_codon:yes gene_type:complete